MVLHPTKTFYPLESNPEVFNKLVRLLGVSPRLRFEDIYTLDDDDHDDHLPHPALALVLVFPADDVLEADARSDRPEYVGSGGGDTEEEPVVWFKQTIGNACGLYAALHAVCNGGAREFIEPGGLFARLLERCIPLAPPARAKVLEESAELEDAYGKVALEGDSAVPESADAEVEFHYVCYVRDRSGRVWELDGDRKGPIDTGLVLGDEEDVCCRRVLRLVKDYVDEAGGKLGFGLMALVDGGGEGSR